MIGNTEILNARIGGETPPHVWIHVLDTQPPYWLAQDAADSISNGFRAQILILPAESIAGLETALLKGLTVHVIGENKARCLAVINRCKPYAERILYASSHGFMDTGADHDNA